MDELHDWNAALSRIRATRTLFVRLFENTPEAKWELVPSGHRNHMLWNFGHATVTSSLLIYKPAGLELSIPQELFDAYRKGSVPLEEGESSNVQNRLKSIVEWGNQQLRQIEQDAKGGIFVHRFAYETSYGPILTHSLEAAQFVAVHEAMHLGIALAQAKSLARFDS